MTAMIQRREDMTSHRSDNLHALYFLILECQLVAAIMWSRPTSSGHD